MVTDNFPDISFIEDATIEEVMVTMIQDYQDKYKELTGREVSLGQADPYRLIMYACAVQIYQAMQYADYAGKMSFLKYANGEYLDNLAAIRGVTRLKATPATTTLKFTIDSPLQSAVSIPAGTRATNGNNVFFATDTYTEIKVGQTTVSVSATCTDEGALGNNFAEGEINMLVTALPYITRVENTVLTFGGSDTESDDDLRDRTFEKPESYSTAGPSGAYRYFVKQVDTSISDVIVRSDNPGEVQVLFITDNGMPSAPLIEKVKTALEDRSVRPLTDKIVVKAPGTKAYNVDLTYYISSSEKASVAAIQENVNAAVEIYNLWQTEKIGRDINPSYLTQQIMEAGAKRVSITAPVFTVLNNDVLATTGTVSVKYGGLEDD